MRALQQWIYRQVMPGYSIKSYDQKMSEEGNTTMKRVTVLYLLLLGVVAAKNPEPPKWPTKYSVQGVLQLPYAEIKEPFKAWFDSEAGKSRIDYYDIMKTLQIAKKANEEADFGTSYKLVPMTLNSSYLNQQTCFRVNGTENNTVEVQSILPDLTGFHYIGAFHYGDTPCNLFQNVTVIGNKKNTYTMWVDNNSHPVQYEMFGYDTLLGSHYDKYLLTYTNFTTTVDAKVFDLVKNLTCGGFPGPGAEHRVLVNPISEYMDNNNGHHEVLFKHFKHKHSKSYADYKEESHRLSQFRHNVRFIHSKNRQGLSYTLAINHLADQTPAELKALNGRMHSKGYNGGLPFNKHQYDLKYIPEHIDWRLYGAVTQVKDQAVCGSCWSFGTTGAIEGAYFLKTGKLVRLSQQQLVDCSWGEGNNGCDGGEDFRAYSWIMKHNGLASEEDYGDYLAIDGYCKWNATSTAFLKGFVNVSSEHDPQALKVAIAKHGPVSVGIDAAHKSLSFYSNGIYYEPECAPPYVRHSYYKTNGRGWLSGNKEDNLDHAVLAVGYGVLNGEPYWLIKNSWSTYWGNNGYVLMSQRDNNCGVATQPTFVLM